jgi:prepilin-type N-terminal cleavage/methylation domain-containing protein
MKPLKMKIKTQIKSRGLTLIEVLVSMGILATLMAFSAQSLRQALLNKSKIQSQLDEMSQVRDALNIIRKDLELAIHYLDFEFEFNEAVKTQALAQIQRSVSPQAPAPPAASPGTPPSPPLPPNMTLPPGGALLTPEQQIRLSEYKAKLEQKFPTQNPLRLSPATHFRGLEDKMFFVTSHSLEAPSSDESFLEPFYLAKVSYQVHPCPLNSKIKCLIRFQQRSTDGDLEQVQNGMTLLEGISDFSLKYIGKQQQDWVNRWDSRKNDPAQFQLYPEGVEINMTRSQGEGSKEKKVTMRAVTYLHFPNNSNNPTQGRRHRRGL